jgi:diguanylate cyclase (GGDEF)-like protein
MLLEPGVWGLAALSVGVTGAGGWAWRRLRGRGHRRTTEASPAEPHKDTLTGLPFRGEFDAALLRVAHQADLDGSGLCVLCIGIDGFELLNNTYGRAAGDAALQELAERIQAIARPGYPAARLGGAEFLLAVPGTLDAGRAAATATLARLSEPLSAAGHRVLTSCSIGLAAYPEHGACTVLVVYAELAMRAGRDSGGGCHATYARRMSDNQREQAELARDLRGAIERREMSLYYQPKVDARSLQITAAEALLRWQHPRRGVISPALFIPIAERHGLIGSLGCWVLEEATRQAAEWRSRGLRMRMAINVSGVQMRQDGFTERLASQLASHGLRPGRFTCEITESVAMEDTQATQQAFARLAQLGVHVSIDDFGTGHSSLALLRRLRAAELKIDRAFVTDLGRSADALAVVTAIVQLAHSLDMRVVAEGVENESQRDHLLALGCDELQGYLFAKPMSARALEMWAANDAESPLPTFRPSLFSDTRSGEFDG